MNIKELKKQLKREKENYYDKDKLKRYFHKFVNQPDIKLYKIGGLKHDSMSKLRW